MYICITCKQELSKEKFSKKPNTKTGLSGKCKDCHNTYVREVWYPKNSDRQKLSSRNWKLSNKDRVIATRYKVSEEEILELKQKAGNCCEVCKSTKNLRVDHCHKTLKIRGILCNSCNVTLGLVKDSSDILQNLIKYLLRDAKDSQPDS